MTADRNSTDSFAQFMAIYPEREGGQDRDAAHIEWVKATKRAAPASIIDGAVRYRMATQGRPARYIMSARRWLADSHWRDAAMSSAPPCAALVWIPYGSKEWSAWAEHYRATRGKTPPQDRRGGWRFPSLIPPSLS